MTIENDSQEASGPRSRAHSEFDAEPMGERWIVGCRGCGWGAFTDSPAPAHAGHLSDIERYIQRTSA